MRVTCEHCGRQLNLPDDKVPDRPFTMTCPGCKGKLHVDPKAVAGEDPGDETRDAYPEPVAPQAQAAQVWSPNGGGARQRSQHDTGSLSRLTALAPADQQLLDRASPLALVVSLGLPPAPELTELLQAVGMEEVRHYSDLSEACEEAAEADVGVLLIRVEKATPPPFDALAPIYKLPAEIRRRVFFALLADNVRSLDGQAAFYLQVNCVLSAQEMESFPTKLRRALLHHLRLYRYWAAEE